MMNKRTSLLLLSVLVLLAACREQPAENAPAAAAETEMAEPVAPRDQLDVPEVALTVAGTVSLPAGQQWPEDADLRVAISDTSRADAPALLLAESLLQPEGEDPVHYTIEVNEHDINPSHSYSVRATMRDPASDALLLTSDTHHPVITRDAGFSADIQLVSVPAVASTASGNPAVAGLTDSKWLLVGLGEETVAPATEERRPSLQLDSTEQRASGLAGCNRFTGSYQLDGQSLSFGPLAMTSMLCADGMELEQAFSQVLTDTDNWRLAEGRLQLLKGAMVLAELQPAD